MTVVRIASPAKYLLLPVQESNNETGKTGYEQSADTYMDVRLATIIEYYVPFASPQGAAEAVVVVKNVAADALCCGTALRLQIPLIQQTETNSVRLSSSALWLDE